MRPKSVTKHPMKCTCNTTPLLCMYGKNEQGKAYVHVRIFKGPRVYGEIYTTSPISLLCRMCGRWWNINVRNEYVQFDERKAPEAIDPAKPKIEMLDTPATPT